MEYHNLLRIIIEILVTIAALKWGAVGLFDFEPVSRIFGRGSAMTRFIYILFGLAGVGMILVLFKVL